jgi:hypothetical protein
MYRPKGRAQEAAERFAERRRREDSAPRLSEEIPALANLRLEVEERAGTCVGADSKHVRHVIVDRAPALFVLPCGDTTCRDGGHDLTANILRELRSATSRFEAEAACRGTVGPTECRRSIKVVGIAAYR